MWASAGLHPIPLRLRPGLLALRSPLKGSFHYLHSCSTCQRGLLLESPRPASAWILQA